jgi:potassium/hydrogen antiporter
VNGAGRRPVGAPRTASLAHEGPPRLAGPMSDGALILVTGALLALGIAASLAAGRLRVPGLILFLALGMAIGSDGLGLIEFDDFELTRTVGIVALVLILFEGGLTAGWPEIRPVFWPAASLATIGTLLTAVIVGVAAAWLLDLPLLYGMLLGSIVSTTDSAAIFSVLRGSSLRRRTARVLEAESGLNDPIAVLLVIGFIEWIERPEGGLANMAILLVEELGIGALVGLACGALSVAAFRRVPFVSSGLYPVASIATAAISFGLADVLHGSGFLAVYLAGLALGGSRVPARATIADFHAGVGWVSQIVLFFTLGLLVFPMDLVPIAEEGLLLAFVLAVVARPVAALVATRVGRFPPRESLLIGWAGLRGAIPIVLATFPVIAGVPRADDFFDIVFFVVLTSTLIQGATFEPLARALGVTASERARPRPLVEVGAIRQLGAEVVEYPVGEGEAVVGHVVNELGLPRDALVNVIVRDGEALLPRGSTRVEAGDVLHILTRETARDEVEALHERWRKGPMLEPAEPATRTTGRATIFTVRPWAPGDGDLSEPHAVGGVPVARRLRTRREQGGALVQLADGRFAVTGEGRVAVGGSRQLLRYCRERIARAREPEERAWWQEAAGVVSQRSIG